MDFVSRAWIRATGCTGGRKTDGAVPSAKLSRYHVNDCWNKSGGLLGR